MIIIDGKGSILGRVASYASKQALKGEEIIILNSEDLIISGNKNFIREEFHKKRSRVGHGQRGPKHSKTIVGIVKRAIRGMVPNYREGRGREAFKRIKCYIGIPKEFENKRTITFEREKPIKFAKVQEFIK